jgi:ribonuclease HII
MSQRRPPGSGSGRAPSLRFERRLLRDGVRLLAGVDEVGRGALAGPVSVGVVVIDADVRSAPAGLRDSKLLTPAARERLAPRVRHWAVASAVGHASAAEIDAVGIIRALRLAAERALAGLPTMPDHVLLDGSHDWLTRRPEQVDLFAAADPGDPLLPAAPPVTTRVKADLTCSAVAAASVLAKTERDAIMRELAVTHPAFGWDVNKGYAAPEHLAALQERGACAQHRRSWNLRAAGTSEAGGTQDGDDATWQSASLDEEIA